MASVWQCLISSASDNDLLLVSSGCFADHASTEEIEAAVLDRLYRSNDAMTDLAIRRSLWEDKDTVSDYKSKVRSAANTKLMRLLRGRV